MSSGYTILSAAWSSDPECVIVQTAESGSIAVSQRDRPELWAQLMASGVEIAPYTEPKAIFAGGVEEAPDTVAPAAAILLGANKRGVFAVREEVGSDAMASALR